MNFLFGDGSVRFYRAVASTVHLEGHQALVFFLLLPSLPSGELDPTQPATAVARQSLEPRDNNILWEIDGTQLYPGTLRFEVTGEIQAIPRSEAQPRPFAPLWFSLRYPPQQVRIQETEVVASFQARAKVRRDHTAEGLMELLLVNGQKPLRFEPVFGSVIPESETGPAVIIILFVLDGAPLLFENLAIATVRPNPALPGCDIWDFTSNVSRFRVQFDAVGRVRFHGPSEASSDAGLAVP